MNLKRPIIASVHDSHRPFRLKPRWRKVVVNFGQTVDRNQGALVVNHYSAVARATDKMRMKRLFEEKKIPSFRWGGIFHNLPFPIVLKSTLHIKLDPHLRLVKDAVELDDALRGRRWERFYWEQFTPYSREFRIHVSKWKWNEVFACEKRYRGNIDWVRNKSTCVFERTFAKPSAWRKILRACKKVLRVTGLDIAGFDVAVEGENFWIIEMNTACGMGHLTREAYTKELNKVTLIKQFTI